MIKTITSILLLIATCGLMAQDSTEKKSSFTFGLFADVYYSYDFNKPEDHLKPSFFYNYNRHNEVNLNFGMIRGSYNNDKIRANLGLMAGTYAQYNLAAEPELLRHVYEANAGVKIARNSNIWIDAGIMSSHIGFESAISKDNWTLTRSMAAENSPYYESGAKITCTTKSGKLSLSGLLLNGWQRIQRPPANNTLAYGTQLSIKPNDNITFNWSTFIGNDKPDSAKQWRYFNDLYGIFQFNDKIGLILGFDIGVEQQSTDNSSMNMWFSPTFVARFTPNVKWAIAARAEYYNDESGVIISTGTPNGFKTFGASLNIDRRITDFFWWRTEIKTLKSKDAIFTKEGNTTTGNTAFTTSFAINF